MSEPVWYRSLYWRIALAFVGLVATLLVVQGGVFLWMSGRTDLFPSRSAAQYAAAIAADLSEELTRNPTVALEPHLRERFGRGLRAFAVATNDGQVIVGGRVPPPPSLARAARAQLRGQPPGGGRRGGWGFDRDWRSEGRSSRGDGPPGGPPFGGPEFVFSSVYVEGALRAAVAVPAGPPPLSATLRGLGPLLAGVAFVLLLVGTAAAALLVFHPAHRRLRALQQAATAVGTGQSGVRAPESGGDEVASLARAFNDMAARLEERTHALETADRTRRQLLADVSHELTTPLAAIRGYVETLQMPDVPLDPATRDRYLRIVSDETERLEHIVGDLLDLARLEGGGGALKIDRVAMPSLFQRIRHRHEQALEESQVSLETRLSDEAAIVRGDGNRLEQALQNLVANAVRHTPPRGRILVAAERAGPDIQIVVEDTGPGIPPEHLPHVFDRFYKADVSRTGADLRTGSGLGLSIVQAIVRRHGGMVTASNAPSGGARFVMTLPAGD
jgi:signal transduction histidine kinase